MMPIEQGKEALDIDQAREFLESLDDSETQWTFQTFDDTGDHRPGFAHIIHGAIDNCFDELAGLNLRGAGVYITVNKTDGQGRKETNIKAVRAVFVDLDGAPLEPVQNALLEPHIIVESSPGRWHAYWLVDDCPLYDFRRIQKTLIAKFNADKAVHDLPRVMRLPGFFHNKSGVNPFISKIVNQSPIVKPYTLDEVVAAFQVPDELPHEQKEYTGKSAGILFLSPQVRDIRSALASLNPVELTRDERILIGCSLYHPSNGSNQAFSLWTDWLQQWEEFSLPKARRNWVSFGSRDDSNTVTLGTLFDMAEKRSGWVNIARKDQQFDNQTESLLKEANEGQTIETIVKPSLVNQFPIDSLNRVAEWIDSQSDATWPVATQQAVLSLVSVAASRCYQSETGDAAHTYMGIVAQSVGQTRYATKAISQIMRDAGLRRIIRETRFTNPVHVYQALYKSPSCIYLSNDYGQILAFAKRQPSGLQEQTLAVISDIYDQKHVNLDGDTVALKSQKKSQEDQPVLVQPALSLLALLSDDQLAGVMRRGELGRGALEQLCLVFIDQEDEVNRTPVEQRTPQWLIDHILKIRDLSSKGQTLDLPEIFQGNVELEPVLGVTHFDSPDTERLILEFEKELRKIAKDRIRHYGSAVAIGARKTLRRLCVGMSAWNDPDVPVINRNIANWCGQYMLGVLNSFLDHYETLSSDDGKLDVYQSVVAYIQQYGAIGISNRELIQRCRQYKSLVKEKREELIQLLIEDESIIEKKSGRKKVFISSIFVKKQQFEVEGNEHD